MKVTNKNHYHNQQEYEWQKMTMMTVCSWS